MTAIRLSGETSVGAALAQVRDEPRRRVEEPQGWTAMAPSPAVMPLSWVAKPQGDPPKANPVTEDLSRPLHEPIELGGGRQLATLRDVEDHLATLTETQRTFRSWRLVEQAVAEAARGGNIREVVHAVKLARILDR